METKKAIPMGVELVKRGIVTQEDIERALDYQRFHPDKRIGDILHLLEVCDPSDLIKAIGDIIGEEGIYLKANSIKVHLTDYISLEMAKKHKAIPFELETGKIKVCFADTAKGTNKESIKMLMLNKGLIMESYITFESDIDRFLATMESTQVNMFKAEGQANTITGLVDNLIRGGFEKRASDIHFEPLENMLRVRYRIDGELYTIAEIEKEKQMQIIGRLKAISNMHQEKQESQDGRILIYEDYNIRVSSQKNIYGEKFVLRLLKKDAKIRNIHELGLTKTDKEINKSINKKNSIAIVAAPTGEGKTTTLYSIIDHLNRPEVNITTIEDPVEIRIGGLNQIEIDAKTSFSDSLRTVLRQDPDIILVGEVRDKETAEIAIQAGQTGHYVLSTIHTIDAVEVITRLRKMGISDYDIASTLATTISQRLVRRLCPHCRKERAFTKDEKLVMLDIAKKYNTEINIGTAKTYTAVGCEHCNNVGYLERIGIFEILEITDEIKELIMNGASSIEIRKLALTQNYEPLVIDGIRKVIDGITTLEELNKKLLFM